MLVGGGGEEEDEVDGRAGRRCSFALDDATVRNEELRLLHTNNTIDHLDIAEIHITKFLLAIFQTTSEKPRKSGRIDVRGESCRVSSIGMMLLIGCGCGGGSGGQVGGEGGRKFVEAPGGGGGGLGCVGSVMVLVVASSPSWLLFGLWSFGCWFSFYP